MLRNIIIILVSVAVVAWNLYVFKNRKKYSFTAKNYTVGLLVIWFMSTVLFNIPVLLSPLTPVINGKVIDAETKQPLANCNIKVYWQIESGTPAGGHKETYHQIFTKTDLKGEFHVPRYIKVLGLYGLFPILVSRYDGITVIVYTHGFKYALTGVNPHSSMLTIIEPSKPSAVSEVIEIEASKPSYLMDDLYRLEEIFRTYNIPSGATNDDKMFLLEEYKYYYVRMATIFKYSKASEIESALFDFANAFKDFGDNEKAIEVW